MMCAVNHVQYTVPGGLSTAVGYPLDTVKVPVRVLFLDYKLKTSPLAFPLLYKKLVPRQRFHQHISLYLVMLVFS